MWNLLDIVLILASVEQCDPNLIFWLVEELLDGQTIDGCRTVFEYLESRRERMIPGRQSQKLVVLRSCNELLRRLSRAEDAAFCGRIFIYMFQSFPLGDRSSVNLRGEFHAENVTIFDVPAAEPPVSEPMDVDDTSGSKALPNPRLSKVGPSDGKPGQISAKPLEPDGLYPIFWGLQTSFSQPKRLFEPDNLAHFKTALGLTVRTFETAGEEQDAQSRSDKGVDKQGEKTKQVLKRKRDKDDDAATGLNPKYLTSRDLFELEVRAPFFLECSQDAKPTADQRSVLPEARPHPGTHYLRLSAVPVRLVQEEEWLTCGAK